MDIVKPYKVNAGNLISTNVDLEHPEWSGGTEYSDGDRVVFGELVFESVEDSNTGNTPDPGMESGPWVWIGYANRWRMFNQGVDSRTSRVGEIDVRLNFGEPVTHITVLGIETAQSVEITVFDPADPNSVIFQSTFEQTDIGARNWWEFYFAPYVNGGQQVFQTLPGFPGSDIRIRIIGLSSTDPVECGRVIAGIPRNIGDTQFGTEIAIQDYSVRERNSFGELILVRRRAIKEVRYNIQVFTNEIGDTVRIIQELAGEPALYIGDEERSETVTFGVFTDVSQGISGPERSELTLAVEEF